LRVQAKGLSNVHFVGYQPIERLAEVLATGDLHVVPLRRGLARVSVPSKTYSILAAGRPILAAIDPGTEVPRILAASGAGRAVDPDDEQAFVAALMAMVADIDGLRAMGEAGRQWVVRHVSPAAVAAQYESLFVADR
jgi:colanic acid biosynthesis glycosyl transferase WcaI